MRPTKMLTALATLAALVFAAARVPVAAALPGQHEAWWEAVQGFHALAGDTALSSSDRAATLARSLEDELASPTPAEASPEAWIWKISFWTPHELTLQHLADALAEVGDGAALRGPLADRGPTGNAREWLLVALGLAGVADVEEGDGAALTEVLRIASSSPDMNLRCKAVEALKEGKLPDDDRVGPALEGLLQDGGFRQDPLWKPPEVVTLYKVVLVAPNKVVTVPKVIDRSKNPMYSWDREYLYPVRMEAFFALRARGVPVQRDPKDFNHYTVVEETPAE